MIEVLLYKSYTQLEVIPTVIIETILNFKNFLTKSAVGYGLGNLVNLQS